MGRASALATLVGVVGVLAAGAADPRPIDPRGVFKLGLPAGMFRDVPPAVVQAAGQPFKDLFKRQTGMDGDIEVTDDTDALADKMARRQIHIGVFHGFEYAWAKLRVPDLTPLVVSVPAGRKLQACLVVNATSKAATPGDLPGDCVAIPQGTKAHCHLYLERLRDGLPTGCCGRAKCDPQSGEEVLDAVVSGKSPAALIDAAQLTGYRANKPGAAACLKVLAQSEPFPAGVVAYRAGVVDAGTAGKIRTGLRSATETAQGRAFMMLWKLKGFEDAPADFPAQLDRVLKAYPPPAAPTAAVVR